MVLNRRSASMRLLPSWRRLDVAARWLVPFIMLLLGLFILGMPFGIPGQAMFRPLYAVGCVYFWSLYRPASLPAPLVALAGLLLDVLGLTPLGIWAVLLLLLQAATLGLRRYLVPSRFLWVWAGFVVLATACASLSWLVECAVHHGFVSAFPILCECLLAVGLYPALAIMLIRAHRGPAALEHT